MHYHIVEAFKCQSVSRFNKERESLQAFLDPSGVWIPEVDHLLSHISKYLDKMWFLTGEIFHFI